LPQLRHRSEAAKKNKPWAIVVVMAKLGGYSRNDQILSQAYLLAQISDRQQVKIGTSHRRGGWSAVLALLCEEFCYSS
jgi:hypothetical protein